MDLFTLSIMGFLFSRFWMNVNFNLMLTFVYIYIYAILLSILVMLPIPVAPRKLVSLPLYQILGVLQIGIRAQGYRELADFQKPKL